MGYERKRGKLADLNALLRGQGTDRFSLIVGRIDVLNDVRYVITLDVDTQLPRGTARQFIGAMAQSIPAVIAAGWDECCVEERGCPYISAARATMKALDAASPPSMTWNPVT